jgi:hypothetical protein
MFRISDASNFRRTLAGVALVAAPIAFGASDVVRLYVEGGAAEGVEQLAAIEAKIGWWRVATVLDMAGIILFVPAILGIMHLLRRRSVVLGHIGGALALLGVLGFAGHNAGYFGMFGAAATSELGHAELYEFFEHAITATPAIIMYVAMFLIGFLFGPILLGIGLYRARAVPRRTAGLLLIGLVAWIVVAFSPWHSNIAAIATVWVLISAGFGGVGLSVLAMSDTEWESVGEKAVDETASTELERTPAEAQLQTQ